MKYVSKIMLFCLSIHSLAQQPVDHAIIKEPPEDNTDSHGAILLKTRQAFDPLLAPLGAAAEIEITTKPMLLIRYRTQSPDPPGHIIKTGRPWDKKQNVVPMPDGFFFQMGFSEEYGAALDPKRPKEKGENSYRRDKWQFYYRQIRPPGHLYTMYFRITQGLQADENLIARIRGKATRVLESIKPRYIADPVEDFRAHPISHLARREDVKIIRADVNNDGTMDMALSDTRGWGRAGGVWFIYLGMADGRYRYWNKEFLGEVFKVIPEGKGSAVIQFSERTGRNEGVVKRYRFTEEGLVYLSGKSFKVEY